MNRRPLYPILLCFALLLTSGCQSHPFSAQPSLEINWQDATPQTIRDTHTGAHLSYQALQARVQQAEVIYLGEEHDNPHHHRLQSAIVQQLVQQGKRPILGFEFFSRDQTAWLMQYSVGKPSRLPTRQAADPAQLLRQRLGWENRPDWENYYPLLALARQHGLTVFGADLSEGLRVRLTRDGMEALTPLERSSWRPSAFVHADYQQWMRERLAHSHCGMASESLLERLYNTWLARNDAMAEAIVTMQPQIDSPVLLIVGAGHIAHNMGIYERVAALRPELRQLNLGMSSFETESFSATAPWPPLQVGASQFPPVHELLWLTPPSPDDSDPCAGWSTPPPANAPER
ncbi:MAG: ChaN family lipoprotein [Magnetococcales bacterium]|nr:ChaN family lipoprotein [Magnetococcales bacterium]